MLLCVLALYAFTCAVTIARYVVNGIGPRNTAVEERARRDPRRAPRLHGWAYRAVAVTARDSNGFGNADGVAIRGGRRVLCREAWRGCRSDCRLHRVDALH